MHKKFLRTLTLVFVQGVLCWSLGLQESAAMDPRLTLEAEYQKNLKILSAHNRPLSGHRKVHMDYKVSAISPDEISKGVVWDSRCLVCDVATKHCCQLLEYLDPQCPSSKKRQNQLTQLVNEWKAERPLLCPRIEAVLQRPNSPDGLQTYARLRLDYTNAVNILLEHDGFFTKHKTPTYERKKIGGPIDEWSVLNSEYRVDNNCSLCETAFKRARTLLEEIDPLLEYVRKEMIENEFQRVRDPRTCKTNAEKFNALIRLAGDCFHPAGSRIARPSDFTAEYYAQQRSKIQACIKSLNTPPYDEGCIDCKGQVRDAIQILLSDSNLCEQTTKKYREEEDRERLKSEELMREQLKERAKEAQEKNSLDRQLLAAKDGTGDAQYAEETSLTQTYASLASCRDCAPHNKQEYSSVPKFTYRTVPGQPYGSFGQIGLPTTVTDTTWVTQTTVTPVPSRNIPTLNTILATVLKMKVDPSYNVRPDEVKTSVGCTFCDPLLNTAFLQLYKSRQSPDDISQMSERVYKKTFGQ